MDSQLRQLVWQRASSRCEYCQFPAQFAEAPFQIDHIIAQKHGGETNAENLALACYYWI
jgi:5-methylcytosine-specific restriction endonuclease McrA